LNSCIVAFEKSFAIISETALSILEEAESARTFENWIAELTDVEALKKSRIHLDPCRHT
jgi:hypothetical protein